MRGGETGIGEIVTAIAGSIVVAAVLLVGALRMAGAAHAFGPVPGDIVAFAPDTTPEEADLRVAAETWSPHHLLCLLEAKEMAAAGGSLIVEARDGEGYHVHWAGGRSSGGSADCGQSRDLVVRRGDLERLAGAAGGFGALGTNLIP